MIYDRECVNKAHRIAEESERVQKNYLTIFCLCANAKNFCLNVNLFWINPERGERRKCLRVGKNLGIFLKFCKTLIFFDFFLKFSG
jgi:hypothetical protein